MSRAADELVAAYLKRLKRELRALPRAHRQELLGEIEEHIAAARAELADESEAAIRTLLDRIGEPEKLAAAARERYGMREARAGAREVWAVVLLLLGGLLVPILGWLAGVALLWSSPIWTRRDKLIGTLLVPGGLSLAFLLIAGAISPTECAGMIGDGGTAVETCTGGGGEGVWTIVVAVAVVGTVGASAYLASRLRGRFLHATSA